MICICVNCGKEFEVQYKCKKRKFCTKSCAQKYRWKDHKKNEKEFICLICGKKFYVPYSDNRIKNNIPIKYCSHKCTGIGLRTGKNVKCKYCGKEFYTTRNEFCSHECAQKYKSENMRHKTYYENGYVIEYDKNYNKKGNVKQHRKIMEEYLGRKLTDNEIVHHINGIKSDNRIENLQVMTRSEHSSMHRKKEKEDGKHLFGGHNNN
jgi:hypothetical protein